jgi:hypothetical protein
LLPGREPLNGEMGCCELRRLPPERVPQPVLAGPRLAVIRRLAHEPLVWRPAVADSLHFAIAGEGSLRPPQPGGDADAILAEWRNETKRKKSNDVSGRDRTAGLSPFEIRRRGRALQPCRT